MITPREYTSTGHRRIPSKRTRTALPRIVPMPSVRARLRRLGSGIETLVRHQPAVGVAALGGLALLAAKALGARRVALALGAGYAYVFLRQARASARKEGAHPGSSGA